MYDALVAISLTVNVVSLVLGMGLIVVVLVLTLSLAAQPLQPSNVQSSPEHSAKFNESEAFGYILSLGPLLIVNSLCGISASQRSTTTTVGLYWFTMLATVSVASWITSEFCTLDNLFSFRDLNIVELISKLVVYICAAQVIAAVVVTLANYQNNRIGAKAEEVTLSGQETTTMLDNEHNSASGPPLRLVDLSL